MGFFKTHAAGTNDPPEVRNWTIHMIALVASMSALASTFEAFISSVLSLSYDSVNIRRPC